MNYFRFAIISCSLMFVACHGGNSPKSAPILSSTKIEAVKTVKVDTAKAKPGNQVAVLASVKPDSIKKRKSSGINYDAWEDSESTISTRKIKYDLFTFHYTSVSNPFNEDSALIKLFPGHYYKMWKSKTDSIDFEYWTSRLTRKHLFRNHFSIDDMDAFPIGDNNETQIVDTMLFTYQGKRSIIMAFATTDLETDFVGMGREDGPCLGLALFKEDSNQWKLQAFCPAVGTYGEFQTMPKLWPAIYSKGNFGCYLSAMVSGPGQAGCEEVYFFGIVDKSFKEILQKSKSCRFARKRNTWITTFKADTVPLSQLFPDLIATTVGDCSTVAFDTTMQMEGADELPASVEKISRHKDNFDFTITTRYTFDGRKYKSSGEKVTTMPHHPSKEIDFEKPLWQ